MALYLSFLSEIALDNTVPKGTALVQYNQAALADSCAKSSTEDPVASSSS
jgi:hypothetical protein